MDPPWVTTVSDGSERWAPCFRIRSSDLCCWPWSSPGPGSPADPAPRCSFAEPSRIPTWARREDSSASRPRCRPCLSTNQRSEFGSRDLHRPIEGHYYIPCWPRPSIAFCRDFLRSLRMRRTRGSALRSALEKSILVWGQKYVTVSP